MRQSKPSDWLGTIVDYEMGLLNEDETIQLFQNLVDTGMAWSLQGRYGRIARALIDNGTITQVATEIKQLT